MSAERPVVGTASLPRRNRAREAPARRAARARARVVAYAVLPLALGACDWFTDFKSQPSYRTWESLISDTIPQRANPVYSVPVTGTGVPGFVVSYAPVAATVDSMSGLRNPVPMSEESLLIGRMHYQINCSVCHGAAGRGNGPVSQFGFPGFPIAVGPATGYTDGYIYGIIRNGRGLMPTYNRIEEMDRWHVVNYVRALQGRGGFTVDTIPFGTPGQTGAALPGATPTAPTRPAPHFQQDSALRRASGTGVGTGGAAQGTAPGSTAPPVSPAPTTPPPSPTSTTPASPTPTGPASSPSPATPRGGGE